MDKKTTEAFASETALTLNLMSKHPPRITSNSHNDYLGKLIILFRP